MCVHSCGVSPPGVYVCVFVCVRACISVSLHVGQTLSLLRACSLSAVVLRECVCAYAIGAVERLAGIQLGVGVLGCWVFGCQGYAA